jgi:hypothetical protein
LELNCFEPFNLFAFFFSLSLSPSTFLHLSISNAMADVKDPKIADGKLAV